MVEEYKRKVVNVGNSICLILPKEWRKLFEHKEVYGVWKVVRDEEGNMVRIEVSFQEGKDSKIICWSKEQTKTVYL